MVPGTTLSEEPERSLGHEYPSCPYCEFWGISAGGEGRCVEVQGCKPTASGGCRSGWVFDSKLAHCVPNATPTGAKADELDFPRDSNANYSVFNLNEYRCLNDEMIRVVYVEYIGGPGLPPCTVVYKKRLPEQPSQVFPWNAEMDVGFCEAKARKLVEKLRGGGWKCGLSRDVQRLNE